MDFGIAGLIVEADKNTAATLKYMTPEMIIKTTSLASPAMDIWAIGIMTFCMLFYRLPFSGATREETKNLITTAEFQIPSHRFTVSPECQQFLVGCLQKNPDDRLTIK